MLGAPFHHLFSYLRQLLLTFLPGLRCISLTILRHLASTSPHLKRLSQAHLRITVTIDGQFEEDCGFCCDVGRGFGDLAAGKRLRVWSGVGGGGALGGELALAGGGGWDWEDLLGFLALVVGVGVVGDCGGGCGVLLGVEEVELLHDLC